MLHSTGESSIVSLRMPTGDADKRPAVATPRDQAHFAAIAAAEAAEEEARFARAAATPPGERILAGARLSAVFPLTPAVLAELDARADGQMEIARRRIALGLGTKARG